MEKTVRFERHGNVALISLNRPDRHNAICQDLLIEMYNYIDEVSSDNDFKVAVITGNGKSFCVGTDLTVIGKDNLLNPRGDGKDMRGICL